MDKVLIFSPDRCTGCSLCELICSLVHTQTCNPERSRIRILKKEQKFVITQTFCQQCENAACITACPVSAIKNNESLGTIEIDHELCVECKLCIKACPFKGIYHDNIDEKIIACDLCGGDPECVKYCETKAIEFLEKDPVVLQKKKKSLQELKRLLKLMQEPKSDLGSNGKRRGRRRK
jgi:anaerobic carbon-monoxide dehydrogenase iron sulfur subunit